MRPGVKYLLAGLLFAVPAIAQDRVDVEFPDNGPGQNPGQGGSNIEGDLNTNTQNSNNNNVNKTYNGQGSSGMPVSSSIAPSLMSSGNDSCLMSTSNGVQLFTVGASRGEYTQDAECNRRKNAKTLKELGMSVAAVSLMCQDPSIWRAMFSAGTPCPVAISGRLVVGRAAFLTMRKEPAVFIPDYEGNEEYYQRMLGIGASGDEENVLPNTSGTISERFRSTIRSDSSG